MPGVFDQDRIADPGRQEIEQRHSIGEVKVHSGMVPRRPAARNRA
jgi:hypothetical protein